mgnify:CR=1 FL=1
MKPKILLVHGAWHNGAGFDLLRGELDKLGINSKVVELSSVAKENEPIGDMYQDAQIVRSAVDSISGDCVVLGHSYGGLSLTEGLVGAKNVKKLIFLTAFVLDKGETLFQACGSVDPAWWVRNSDNTRLTTENPAAVFYNTCSKEIADKAVAQLRTHSLLSFNQEITKTAWSEIDSAYIICEQDQAIPVFAQEAMSGRCKEVVRINTDHSPFLCAPAELAKIINDLI